MGFETVVRPVVFPNIRPAPARALRIEDAPDKGLAAITGSGGAKVIDLPYSYSGSWSRSQQVEKKRTFDVGRIYSQDKSGNIDKDSYIEAEFVNSLTYSDKSSQKFTKVQGSDNLEIIRQNVSRNS